MAATDVVALSRANEFGTYTTGSPTHAEARRVIVAWVNHYNHQRLHSSVDYTPPIQWESRYRRITGADKAA